MKFPSQAGSVMPRGIGAHYCLPRLTRNEAALDRRANSGGYVVKDAVC